MKKKSRYNKYDILEIVWLDSHSSGSWKVPSDFDEWVDSAKRDFLIHTVGYFVQEDENFIRLSMGHDNQSKNRDGEGRDNLDHGYAVVKPCIRSIKVIRKI